MEVSELWKGSDQQELVLDDCTGQRVPLRRDSGGGSDGYRAQLMAQRKLLWGRELCIGWDTAPENKLAKGTIKGILGPGDLKGTEIGLLSLQCYRNFW